MPRPRVESVRHDGNLDLTIGMGVFAMTDSFLSHDELHALGLKAFGKNCKVSRFARIYGAPAISLGDHVRIDDFSILSGEIVLQDYIHIASHCTLHGGKGDARITMQSFSGLSARVSIYARSDDYSGEWLTNPTVPADFTNVISKGVTIGRHAIIGTGTVVLPGVTIGEGAAAGAMTLVNKSLDPFMIYAGNPARPLKPRSRTFLDHEKAMLDRG